MLIVIILFMVFRQTLIQVAGFIPGAMEQ
jgi:hypothetical protein